MSFSAETEEIACPGCGSAIVVAVSQISPGSSVACSACGATIEFQGDDVAAAAAALDAAFDGLDPKE